MTEEYLDVLDEKGNKMGQRKLRSEVHRDGDWHELIFVFVMNKQNKVLMQKRSPLKKTFGGKWDMAAAGHVVAGEDAKTTAVRELEEELGLKINKEDLQFLFTNFREELIETAHHIHRSVDRIFLVKKDFDLNTVKFQRDEVIGVKDIELEDLKSALTHHDSNYAYRPFYLKIFKALERQK